MTAITPPSYIQAASHPADVFRRALSFVGAGLQGVRSWVSGDLVVTANGTPNMSVNVAAGQAAVNGTQNATTQGGYFALTNDATVNLAIAASDPTNPRIDIVVAQVRDAAYSGANNDWILAVVTGTPAGSPAPPATPANAIVLAQVAVAANAATIVSGNITDKRPIFGSLFHSEAYLAAASQGINTSATVAYDTIEGDPNGNISGLGSTSFLYTCPVAGRYRVSAYIQWQTFPNTATATMDVQKNASTSGGRRFGQISPAVNNLNFEQGGSTEIRCAAADTLRIAVAQTSGGNLNLLGGTAGFLTNAQFAWLGPL